MPNAVVWEHVYSQDRPTSLASGIVGEADTLLRTVYDHYASGNSGGTVSLDPNDVVNTAVNKKAKMNT